MWYPPFLVKPRSDYVVSLSQCREVIQNSKEVLSLLQEKTPTFKPVIAIIQVSWECGSVFLFYDVFFFFWLFWVFAATHGLSLVVMCGLLIVVASLVAEHGLLMPAFNQYMVCCGTWVYLLCGMWNLPAQGSNLCPLCWQTDSLPLDYQRSPGVFQSRLYTDSHLHFSSQTCHWGLGEEGEASAGNAVVSPSIWSFCCFRVTGQVPLCLCLSTFGVGNFQRLGGRCSHNLRYAGYTVAKYKFLSDVIWGQRGKSCLFVSMEDRSLLRHGIWWSYYLVSKACLESEGPEAMACQKDFKFHICLLTLDPSLPAAVGTICHLCWHTRWCLVWASATIVLGMHLMYQKSCLISAVISRPESYAQVTCFLWSLFLQR